MALKAEIQSVVSSMVGDGTAIPPEFIFGTEKELNLKVDDVQLSDVQFDAGGIATTDLFPVVFMYSLQPVGNTYTNNNSMNNNFGVFMFFGFKIDFGDDTDRCEPLDVAIIDLINEFLIRLKNLRGDNQGKVFEVNVNDTSKSKPVFNKDDVNLYGRILTMDLKTFYNKKLCF